MRHFLKLGLIQPVVDPDTSWGSDGVKHYHLNIDGVTAERVWQEINYGLSSMSKDGNLPDIILIPELHLPVSKVSSIKEFSKRHNVMVIAGVDFQRNPVHTNKIRNRGILTIPNQWGASGKSTRLSALHFGKSYFTYMERQMFGKGVQTGAEVISPAVEDPEQNMYVFRSKKFGSFGIMICSDIFDIERMMLYQGRIHHLFIISLNKDLNTYSSMAEALTRMLYCNVVICNTGHYGGSLAVSPYENPIERTIYRYIGQRMFNSHVLNIPVNELDRAQKFDFVKDNKKKKKILFKACPPGYTVK